MNIDKLLEIKNDFLYRRPLKDLYFYKSNNCISDPILHNAIFFSSDSFFDLLNREDYLNNEGICKTLFKYSLRIGSKATPFGLFAGVGMGNFSATATDDLSSVNTLKFDAKLNFQFYRDTIFEKLRKCELFILSQIFIINQSLYEIGSEYRYYERKLGEKFDSYELNKLEKDEVLEEVFNCCRSKKTGKEIINQLLIKKYAENYEEALDFLLELIKSNVIDFNLNYEILNKDFHLKVREYIANSDNCEEFYDLLENFIDFNKNSNTSKTFDEAEIFFNELLFSLKEKKDFFKKHIDISMFFDKNIQLNLDIKKHLKKGFLALHYFTSRTESPSDIRDFIIKFRQNYEGNRVPLLEALDPEIGIGFGPINSYSITPPDFIDFSSNIMNRKNYTRSNLFNQSSFNKNFNSININFNDIPIEAKEFINLPKTTSICFELLKSSTKSKPYIHIKFAGGSSASNLLSRFSSLDKGIQCHIDDLTTVEKNSASNEKKILAEIAYLPRLISGSSILNRKNFYEYEIPIFNTSSLSDKSTINLSELYLHLDSNDEICLSLHDGTPVIPQNTSAHDFSFFTNHIYHFLSSIQEPSSVDLRLLFDWEEIKHGTVHPRIVLSERIILSLTKWVFFIKKISKVQLLTDIMHLKDEYNLPEKVWYFKSFDDKLLVDFTDKRTLEFLINEIKSEKIIFEEFIEPYCENKGQIYNIEFISAIINNYKD